MKCSVESSSPLPPLPIDFLSRKQSIFFKRPRIRSDNTKNREKEKVLTDNDQTYLLKDTYVSCFYESERLRSGDATSKSRFSLNVSDAISSFLLFFSTHTARTWSSKGEQQCREKQEQQQILHNQSICSHDADAFHHNHFIRSYFLSPMF
jgi:hypothetical protein